MIPQLSDLVDMIERGTVPRWLRESIISNKDSIAKALRDGTSITFVGPNQEMVTIGTHKAIKEFGSLFRSVLDD